VLCQLPRCLQIGIDPVAFHLGPFALYWYGLLIAAGFIVAVRLGLHEAEREGLDADRVLSAALVAALLGLVGARLLFILTNQPGHYLDPKYIGDALSLSTAGLSLGGAIAGASLGLWLYCSRFGLPVLPVADVAALAAPLGIAIGRVGSVVNGDSAGYVTQNFGIAYTNPNSLFIPATRLFHPAQPVMLYDAAFQLALFAALWYAHRRMKLSPPPGSLAGVYLAATGAGQLMIGAFRDSPTVLLGLKSSQLVALVMVATGVWLFMSRQNATRVPPGGR
jgi:phosphatidylglycerol:prolipoprotein diacylglycerol transferase